MSRDLWQGDYTRPLSLNGWNYGYANPINFTDPSGFDPLDRKWQDDFQKRTGREPAFEDVMARLFEVTYPKEWNWEDFYNSDGSIDIEEYVRKLTAPPSSRSWEDFPQALTRLASNYNIDEKDIFVRDVGTLYAGLPTRFGTRSLLLPVNTIISLLRSWGGTGQTSAYLSRSGLPPEWIGTDRDSNVHHWAATFVLGYFYGKNIGRVQNILRECVTYNQENFWADIILGNRAARMGYALKRNRFAEYENYPFPWGPFTRHLWQNSLEKLWDFYMGE
jgi:hypothetical protein